MILWHIKNGFIWFDDCSKGSDDSTLSSLVIRVYRSKSFFLLAGRWRRKLSLIYSTLYWPMTIFHTEWSLMTRFSIQSLVFSMGHRGWTRMLKFRGYREFSDLSGWLLISIRRWVLPMSMFCAKNNLSVILPVIVILLVLTSKNIYIRMRYEI